MAASVSEASAAAATSAASSSIFVGPLTVRADAAEIEAFRREALGAAGGAPVPFTFPVRWFTHPEIRSASFAELASLEPWVPIHESQSFDYERPLEPDTDYRMTVEITREHDPARLILRAEIGAASGADICLRVEMILRIIRANPETAA